jgi:hypothetical protein
VRYVVKRADGTTAYATSAVPAGAATNWLATITGGLAPGTYTVHTYIVGTSYDGEGPTATLAVKFKVCVLYDTTKEYKAGSTVPIKLQLCSAANVNLSAAAIIVHAVSTTKTSTTVSGTVADSGNANPDNDFRYDATLPGYIYNLSTKGLTTGTYLLTFTVQDSAGSPSTQSYTTQFQVK